MQKKLYKSRQDAALSGVCAGLAEYLNLDVVVVRLLAVIFAFVSFGTVVIAYVVAAFVIPDAPVVRREDGTNQRIYETTCEYTSDDSQEAGAAEFHGAGGADPYEKQDGKPSEGSGSRKSSSSWILGIVLIAVGAYMILDWFFPFISWRFMAAGVMIALGFMVLLRK